MAVLAGLPLTLLPLKAMPPTESLLSEKLVHAILIVIALSTGAGKICSASRVYEPDVVELGWPKANPKPTPMFSANDRSRWATIRALVDEGSYVIGRDDAVNGDTGVIFEEGWNSIDIVQNPETLEFFSSKPPLLSTLVAGLYWLLKSLFGWTLKNDTFLVVRTILIVVNLVPFGIYLWLMSRLLVRFAVSEWARIYVLGAACFATLMTPFLITLNNHTVATCCVVFAIYPILPLLKLPLKPRPVDSFSSPIRLVLSGLFAGFTACNELPAAAFTVALGGALLCVSPRKTLLFFAPSILIPLAAQLFTNYLALGEFSPAYSKFGGPWYEFPGSHWTKPPPGVIYHGIDWAWMHETRVEYAFHILIGHHGLFSLSPIWLLAVAGMLWAVRSFWRQRPAWCSETNSGVQPTVLGMLTLLVTAVVVGFYLVKSDNYGGWTSGLRWLMWLTPLWLLTMIPVVDLLGKNRVDRVFALGLLAWSVFSVSYRLWNPWRHPWLYDWLDYAGVIAY